MAESRRTEKVLRESEERFRALVDASVQIVWTADAECAVVEDSPSWRAFTGQTYEQWKGWGWLDVFHPEDRERVAALWRKAVEEKTPVNTEYRIRHVSGEWCWTSVRAVPILNTDGSIRSWIGMNTDITERKQAEELLIERTRLAALAADVVLALTQSETLREMLRRSVEAMVQHLGAAFARIWTLNGEENVLELQASAGMYTHLDGAHSRIPVGRFKIGLIAEERAPHLTNDVQNDPRVSDREWAKQAGMVAFAGYPLIVGNRLIGVMAMFAYQPLTDVTLQAMASVANGIALGIERKRAEEALRESEARFRSMADNAPVMVWITEPDASCTYLSKSWYEFTGQTEETGLGFGWVDAVHPDDRDNARDIFLAASAKREAFRLEYRLRRRGGEYRWAIDSAAPRLGPQGEFLGYIGSVIDITERKQAEEEREQLLAREQTARREAEESNRIKDEFLATVSHELRTPLTAIIGCSTMLRSTKLDETTFANALETIQRNAKAQSQLIEDLMDVSRIITGKLRLDVRPVELTSVVEAAIEAVRLAAEAKSIRLQAVLDPCAGPVSGDPNRLQQVIWNLLSNAIKFTPKGGRVQVRLECINSHVEIAVSDTGQGISAEFLPYVFDRFRQADAATTRVHGGLGLGLAIVRHLVELHGGTVRVDSPGEGQGATFTVQLPLRIIHREPGSEEQRKHPRAESGGALECPPQLDGLRVLVVDDEPDARQLLAVVLGQCGAKVTVVASAGEALEALERDRPDVLISDIGMPGEDGYTLIRKVRALPAERGGRIPAAALTAYAGAEARKRALLAGYQLHIPKPVEPTELVAVVASLAGRIGQA